MSNIKIDGKSVFYNKTGSGKVIVFIHGYLETHEVFNEFSLKFPNNTIIALDLPGHGQSPVFGKEHSMDFMAQTVKQILEKENIKKCYIYGHSMGGYVALAFSRLFPESTLGVGLVNSTIYADNDEKKLARDREIKLIESGKQNIVISNLMQKIVFQPNLTNCQTQINNIIENAKQFAPDGIIANIRGMKSRIKHDVNSKIPFHLIGSDNDNFISSETYTLMKLENPNIVYSHIINAGHCTFIEQPDQVSESILDFINHLNHDF